MKSVVINKFGDSNVFTLTHTNKPLIQPGHILLEVKATSVNPLDTKLRQGTFPGLIPQFPMILHGDVAGVVTDVADDVTKFKVGDEVYGCAGGLMAMQGALSEFMLADADLIALKPQTLSFAEAAALPLVSLTAWEALITKGKVEKNQMILIHGGTGGVGHVAIQLGKWLGAKIFATSSNAEKCAIAKKLGADVTINYKNTTVEEYVRDNTNNCGFDLVLDTVGGENIDQSIKAAAPYGQVVSILSSDKIDLDQAFVKNLSLHFVFQPLPLLNGMKRAHYGEILKQIASLVDRGIIKPLLDANQFTMNDVAKAHDHLEQGHAIGKIVIESF